MITVTVHGPIQPKRMDHATRIRWNAFEIYLSKEIKRHIVPIIGREIGETDLSFVSDMVIVKKK